MNTSLLVVTTVLLAFVLFKMFAARPQITLVAALDTIERHGAILIDVREPSEWANGVAAPAVLLPLSDLRHGRKQWGPFLERHRDRKLLLYCHSGMRSAAAAAALHREGFAAVNLGGYSAWVRAGWPTRAPSARAA